MESFEGYERTYLSEAGLIIMWNIIRNFLSSLLEMTDKSWNENNMSDANDPESRFMVLRMFD